MWGGKRDIRPALLNFGIAFALSLGGILFTLIWRKPIKFPKPSPSSHPSDSEDQVDAGEHVSLERRDDRIKEESPCCSTTNSLEEHESSHPLKVCNDDLGNDPSPVGRSHRGRDELPLGELDELGEGFDLASIEDGIPTTKDVAARITNADNCINRDEHEQEIRRLRRMVEILEERERSFEIQLLEYYGLKDQEAAVIELQNQLRATNMQARMLTVKINALQEDKRRLEAQVAEHAAARVELNAAKAKIKQLQKKFIAEVEQNNGHTLELQKKVMMLHDHEQNIVPFRSDIQSRIQKLKDLEDEAFELRKTNHCLKLEKTELAEKLEYVQELATSALGSEEAEALKEEIYNLRQHNDELLREIEQLHADHCFDLEELVYLRWINACLRYELRNFQPSPGKTIARDLSKTLSPRSKEKAKQLILEYADKQDQSEKGISIIDFDYGQWSSSPSSYLTDSGEHEDSSFDTSSANKTNRSNKRKIFEKLRKIIRGKETYPVSGDPGSCSVVSTDAGTRGLGRRWSSSSVQLFDHQKSSRSHDSRTVRCSDSNHLERSCKSSDWGSMPVYRSIGSLREMGIDLLPEIQFPEEADNDQKTELVKYAEVLRESRHKRTRHGRRWASFASV